MPPVLHTAESTDRVIRLVWDDGTTSTFHHVWLRDNCPHCRHAATGHRVVETSAIAGAAPAVVEIAESGDPHVRWSDEHSSVYPADWLRRHDYSNSVRRERFEPVLWDASGAGDLSAVDYPALLTDSAVKLTAALPAHRGRGR